MPPVQQNQAIPPQSASKPLAAKPNGETDKPNTNALAVTKDTKSINNGPAKDTFEISKKGAAGNSFAIPNDSTQKTVAKALHEGEHDPPGDSKPPDVKFPEGGFDVKSLRESYNHLNGTNDPNGIDISVLGQHPHHANLEKAYEAYSKDTRFDAGKRADAEKFAKAEAKRAGDLSFLADTAFIAQADGKNDKLTFDEVLKLDVNNDGKITDLEVSSMRGNYAPITVPENDKPPAKKLNLQPGEYDATAVLGTYYQLDNKTRSGELTKEDLAKGATTAEKKLGILNEIINDPTLGAQFGGDHSVKEAIDREKGTQKNAQFLADNFMSFAPNDAFKSGDMSQFAKRFSTISPDDIKFLAKQDGNEKIITPAELQNIFIARMKEWQKDIASRIIQ